MTPDPIDMLRGMYEKHARALVIMQAVPHADAYPQEPEFYERYCEMRDIEDELNKAMHAHLPALLAVCEAARAMSDRLALIHADPAYASVWTMFHVHHGQYAGPKYDRELADLNAKLSLLRPAQGEGGT